jgi:hypothetical protein
MEKVNVNEMLDKAFEENWEELKNERKDSYVVVSKNLEEEAYILFTAGYMSCYNDFVKKGKEEVEESGEKYLQVENYIENEENSIEVDDFLGGRRVKTRYKLREWEEMNKGELVYEFKRWADNYRIKPEQEDIEVIEALPEDNYMYIISTEDEEWSRFIYEGGAQSNRHSKFMNFVYMSKTFYVDRSLGEDIKIRFVIFGEKGVRV